MFVDIEVQSGNFLISTDKSRLNIEMIHRYLTESYWAKDIPEHLVEKSIAHSLCFGLYKHEKQIGFARVVTDYTTFAYLGDVFVLDAWRGKGLGKWLMSTVMDHPDLYGLRRWLLVTKDMHKLYKKYGFRKLAAPKMLMEIHRPDVYDE
jgi:GNAT superfamily N-acetyltransferase